MRRPVHRQRIFPVLLELQIDEGVVVVVAVIGAEVETAEVVAVVIVSSS